MGSNVREVWRGAHALRDCGRRVIWLPDGVRVRMSTRSRRTRRVGRAYVWLARKYPNAGREWALQWLFPATRGYVESALSLVRDTSLGGSSGLPIRPRTAGPQEREHDHDLHPRAESRSVRRPQSSAQLTSRQDMKIRRLDTNRRASARSCDVAVGGGGVGNSAGPRISGGPAVRLAARRETNRGSDHAPS